MTYWTYQDTIDALQDFSQTSTGTQGDRYARQAIREAYRDLVSQREWTYLSRFGRLTAQAPYATGTITYDATANVLTLTGGTWPSWAKYGSVLIDLIPYDVSAVLSSTTLSFESYSQPGTDITSPTAFTLYQDTYLPPSDFQSCREIYSDLHNWLIEYIPQEKWLIEQRRWKSPSISYNFTFGGDQRWPGRTVIKFSRPPDDADIFDFIYLRRPRDLVIDGANSGTVTVTQNSATITGTNTNFTANMVGSVFRLGTASNVPTRWEDQYPAQQEQLITAVASTTSLTLDSPITGANASGLKYIVSDPVDIDVNVMLNAFLRGTEKQLGYRRALQNIAVLEARYDREFRIAMAADNKFKSDIVAGAGRANGPPIPPSLFLFKTYGGPTNG